MSTLDGWWCEGYIPDGGWIIGAGEEYDDLRFFRIGQQIPALEYNVFGRGRESGGIVEQLLHQLGGFLIPFPFEFSRDAAGQKVFEVRHQAPGEAEIAFPAEAPQRFCVEGQSVSLPDGGEIVDEAVMPFPCRFYSVNRYLAGVVGVVKRNRQIGAGKIFIPSFRKLLFQSW